MNVTNITLELGAGISSTQQSHGVGAKVIISDNFQFWEDIVTAVNSKLDESGGTMTGTLQFSGSGIANDAVFADATARDAAISSPVNGMSCYNTADGVFQDYQGGAWADRDTGTVTPNASTTVAGKVEKATNSEVDAETDTGGTGAELFVVPSKLKRIITQASAGTPASGTDSFVYTDGTTIEVRAFDDMKSDMSPPSASTTVEGIVERATDSR